jgi:hypothetical protein
VAEDREQWHIWAIPIAVVVGGVALRFTDRLWLVDLFDAPGLSETGNFALGFGVAAAWYVFPLIVALVRKLSGWRSPRAGWANGGAVDLRRTGCGRHRRIPEPVPGARTTRLWMIGCPASRQASSRAPFRC